MKAGVGTYDKNVEELEGMLRKMEFKEDDSGQALCARLSTFAGMITRARVLLSYFSSVYDGAYGKLYEKYEKKSSSVKGAEAKTKSELAAVAKVRDDAEALVLGIERASANLNKALDYMEAELKVLGGRRTS